MKHPKKFMKSSLWSMLVLVFGVVVSAQAAPLSLPSGPIYIQFNNLEQIDTSITNSIDVPDSSDGDVYGTAGNWGVLNVSTVQTGAVATNHQDISGGSAFFFDDGINGLPIIGEVFGQITGMFYDIQLTSTTTAKGGVIDLYWTDASSDSIDSSCLNGGCLPDSSTVDKFTSGTFLVRLNFDTGIISGDDVTTLSSTIAVNNITGTGVAEFFASVDTDKVGTWTDILNGDWFWVDTDGDGIYGESGETRDLRLGTFFNLLPAWNDPNNNAIVGVRSNDPARAYVVPEPSTIILLGVGLLGVAGVSRRRNWK